jgi:hypothetical protein
MTEKRFTMDNESDIIEFDSNTNEYIQDFMWADGKGWDRICNRLNELFDENEQLKQVLGNILLEVKRDITITNCTGEIKVFINQNSYELISDVLRKYGALKEWYE